MSKKYRLLFFIIGLVGVGIMLLQVDFKAIDWSHILTTKTIKFLLHMIVLWIGIHVIHAINYKVILGKDGKNTKFLSLLKICITSFALNSVTPAGLVGGEPYVIMELNKHCGTEKSASSTLIFTMFYVMGHVALIFGASILYFVLGYNGGTFIDIFLILTIVISGYLTIRFIVVRDRGLVMSFMTVMTHIPFVKKFFIKLVNQYSELYKTIDNNIIEYRQKNYKFWTSFLLELLSRILEGLEYYFIIRYIVGPTFVSVPDGIIVLAIASLVANLLFIIPMQAGTREGGMALAFSFLDIGSSSVFLIGTLYRVREFLFIIAGILLIWIGKTTTKIQEQIKEKRIEKGKDKDSKGQ